MRTRTHSRPPDADPAEQAARDGRWVAPVALVGPTASGKTEASVELARRLDAEIVVCDSMTLYRQMDVGTAKPGPEERTAVRHHLLDVADPAEPFSVARFQRLAREAIADIGARGRRPLLAGGSGLYFRAAVDDLEFPGTDPRLRAALETEGRALGHERMHARLASFDPEAAARIEPENLRRTIRALEVAALTGSPFSSFAHAWERFPGDRVRVAGVRMASEHLYPRIESRVEEMYETGLLEEVARLIDLGFGGFLTSSQAIGYAEAVRYLRGGLTVDEAKRETVRRTKGLARRQMAWFRRDPRVRWFDVGERGAIERTGAIEAHLLERT